MLLSAIPALPGTIVQDQKSEKKDSLSASPIAPDYSLFWDEQIGDEPMSIDELVAKVKGHGDEAFFSMGNAASNGKARGLVAVNPSVSFPVSDETGGTPTPEPSTALLILAGYITLRIRGVYLEKLRGIVKFSKIH